MPKFIQIANYRNQNQTQDHLSTSSLLLGPSHSRWVSRGDIRAARCILRGEDKGGLTKQASTLTLKAQLSLVFFSTWKITSSDLLYPVGLHIQCFTPCADSAWTQKFRPCHLLSSPLNVLCLTPIPDSKHRTISKALLSTPSWSFHLQSCVMLQPFPLRSLFLWSRAADVNADFLAFGFTFILL